MSNTEVLLYDILLMIDIPVNPSSLKKRRFAGHHVVTIAFYVSVNRSARSLHTRVRTNASCRAEIKRRASLAAAVRATTSPVVVDITID